MTRMTNDLLFVLAQFPATWIFSRTFQFTVLPTLPEFVQNLRRYEIVRKVDYVDRKSFYNFYTYPLYIMLLVYYVHQKTIQNEDSIFQVCFGLLIFINIFGMEMCLQCFSGGRRMNIKESEYWAGSFIASIAVHALREGSICFGLPAIICAGLVEYPNTDPLFYVSVFAAIFDWVGVLHYLLDVKETFPRKMGDTNILSRRPMLDHIGFRIAEYYVIYYIYQLYPNVFYEYKNFLIVTSIYRTTQHIVFFSIRTYFGQTWVDKGPKNDIEETWPIIVSGIAFRVLETCACDIFKLVLLAHMTKEYLKQIK